VSNVNVENWQALGLSASVFFPSRIDGFRFSGARWLKAKDCFPFLHQIKAIARDRFQVGHVRLEKIDLARPTSEQALLFVDLLLQLINLGAALHQFLVRWDKQTHDYEPDREDEEDIENSVKSLPDCGFAALAEIGVGLIHSSDYRGVHGFVTKFFIDSQRRSSMQFN
jgi:hypothetical protein